MDSKTFESVSCSMSIDRYENTLLKHENSFFRDVLVDTYVYKCRVVYNNSILYISAIHFTFLKRCKYKKSFQCLHSCVCIKWTAGSVIEIMMRRVSTCSGVEYKFYYYAVWQINNTNCPKALADIRQYCSGLVASRLPLGLCYCRKNTKHSRSCFTFFTILLFVLNRR